MSGPLINIFLVDKRPIVVLHVGDVVQFDLLPASDLRTVAGLNIKVIVYG